MLKPAGLCRQDACVPGRRPGRLWVGEQLDLTAVAGALGRPVVVDVDAGMMAVALPAELPPTGPRRPAGPGIRTAGPGREHPSSRRMGRDEAFARHLLELVRLPIRPTGMAGPPRRARPLGFTVIAVAIDYSADDVRPWTEGITMPVLYDPHHLLTELYAISNVPTVVWIDEEGPASSGRTAPPSAPTSSPSSPASRPGPISTRSAVGSRDGVVPDHRDRGPGRGRRPDRGRGPGPPPLPGGLGGPPARVTTGPFGGTSAWPAALAPDDLTVWRAGMPLVGEDPFGDAFYLRYEEWRSRGSPAHGLPPVTGTGPAV